MDAYLGEVRMFIGNYAPESWHVCDGSILSISTYQALFSLLGTKYGGDGVSTFGIPNLNGRIPVGTGQITGGQSYPLGQAGGLEGVALQEANIPAHTHTITASTDNGSQNTSSGAYLAAAIDINNPKNTVGVYVNANAADATLSTYGLNQQSITNSAEAGNAHENRQPYITFTYIICLLGNYPSPN